ncbi:MAG: chemotaxis protein CheW, partial [Bacteroidales bacterium]|nr:chemotaxis protein CheW [Bacteroidales bacterium]
MENIEKNKSISYLTFSIGKEKFAAHVSKVQKIVEMQEITTMPQSPDFLLGVINLNGLVLPIIDSRIKMGFPVTEATSDTCTIVCEIVIEEEQIMAGILVDS